MGEGRKVFDHPEKRMNKSKMPMHWETPDCDLPGRSEAMAPHNRVGRRTDAIGGNRCRGLVFIL